MSRISRRRFFVHSAHTTVGVSAAWAAMQSDPWLASAAEPSPVKPIRLCLVSGSLEYKSDESLAAFQQYVEKNHGMQCSRAFIRNEQDLPGLENLASADCMILYTRRLTLPEDQIRRVQEYCRSGKPIVGLRTASHAFQNWLQLDREVFGGDYQGHYGKTEHPQIKIVDSAKDHPVLEGVQPFVSPGSLYKNPKVADDVTVLLTGTIPGHTEPVAWTRLHRGGRVFYTSLGHPDDFRNPNFLRLMVNGIRWATRS